MTSAVLVLDEGISRDAVMKMLFAQIHASLSRKKVNRSPRNLVELPSQSGCSKQRRPPKKSK